MQCCYEKAKSSHKHFWITLPEYTRRLYQKFYTKGNMRHFEGLSWVQIMVSKFFLKISSLSDFAKITAFRAITQFLLLLQYLGMFVINFTVQDLVKLEGSSIKQSIKSHPPAQGFINCSQYNHKHLQAAHAPLQPYICLQLFLLFFPPARSNFRTSHHQPRWSTEVTGPVTPKWIFATQATEAPLKKPRYPHF